MDTCNPKEPQSVAGFLDGNRISDGGEWDDREKWPTKNSHSLNGSQLWKPLFHAESNLRFRSLYRRRSAKGDCVKTMRGDIGAATASADNTRVRPSQERSENRYTIIAVSLPLLATFNCELAKGC
ncbi:hypothetical protein EVAR_100487_1 [Eumeta japonica]|uniref:Uncharacterized protein n=1 Tax=Eumeta variegata TaxID=151549 RepID=A0A4C1SLG6_EUMVA|nr:hypothetical protein EVAR_100487_1 [Eumeta japonica]